MLCLTLAKDLGWTNTRRHPEALPSSRQSGQKEETLPNVWSTRRTSQYDGQVWRGERGRDFTTVSGGFGGFSHLAVPSTLAFPAHLSSQGSDCSTSLPIPSLHPSVDTLPFIPCRVYFHSHSNHPLGHVSFLLFYVDKAMKMGKLPPFPSFDGADDCREHCSSFLHILSETLCPWEQSPV